MNDLFVSLSQLRVSSFRVPALVAAALSFLTCAQVLPEQATVRRVIDGDTIQLTDGRLVRYLGIDAPERRRREGDRWVLNPQPFGEAAAEANRRLVEGKRIHLEYDMRTRDRFGRLLAYVSVGQAMVNEELLKAGYARRLVIPPEEKYADRLRAAEDEARRERRGLWGL